MTNNCNVEFVLCADDRVIASQSERINNDAGSFYGSVMCATSKVRDALNAALSLAIQTATAESDCKKLALDPNNSDISTEEEEEEAV